MEVIVREDYQWQKAARGAAEGTRMKTLCVAVTLAFAVPASAQDGSESGAARTPENAQKFLSVTADQYPIMATSTWQWQHAQVSYRARFASSERCNTTLDGAPQEFWVKMSDGSITQAASDAADRPAAVQALLNQRQDLVTAVKMKTAPYAIDWAKVSSLGYAQYYDSASSSMKAYKNYISLTFEDTALVITVPTEELAARMLLAMETLKKACDKTEGLGF